MQPQFPGIPGPITSIDQRFINIGEVKIEGFDVNIKAIGPATDWGRFSFNLDGTYYRKYDVQQTDGTFAGQVSNQLNAATSGLIPRYKQYATVTWSRGPWSATLGNQYQSSYIDVGYADAHGDDDRVASGGTLSLWDLYGSYTGLQELEVRARRAEPVRQGSAVHEPADDVPGGLRPDVLRCARALRVRLGDVLVQVDTSKHCQQHFTGASRPPFSLRLIQAIADGVPHASADAARITLDCNLYKPRCPMPVLFAPRASRGVDSQFFCFFLRTPLASCPCAGGALSGHISLRAEGCCQPVPAASSSSRP